MNCVIYWPYLPDWVALPHLSCRCGIFCFNQDIWSCYPPTKSWVLGDVGHDQVEAKGEVCKMKLELYKQAADSLKQSLPVSLQCSMDLAQVKGASTWLTSFPIQEFGFVLHEFAFQDALALRYNWQPLWVPSACPCGTKFLLNMLWALSFPKSGFPFILHNEMKGWEVKWSNPQILKLLPPNMRMLLKCISGGLLKV